MMKSPPSYEETILDKQPINAYVGTWQYKDADKMAAVYCLSPVPASLYIDYRDRDTDSIHSYPLTGFSIASDIPEFHMFVQGNRQFRVRVVARTKSLHNLTLVIY